MISVAVRSIPTPIFKFIILKLFLHAYFLWFTFYYRVEAGSGHVLSGSSESHLLYKISGSDLDSALIMASGPDQSDELSVQDGDNISVSPQDISKWVIVGKIIIPERK